MHEYEVRIFNANGQAGIITAEVQLNDHAAVRSAKKLAGGRKFEVWREMDCIYSDNPVPSPTPPPATPLPPSGPSV